MILGFFGSPLGATDREAYVSLTLPNFWNNPLLWSPQGEPNSGDNVRIGTAVLLEPGEEFSLFNVPVVYVTSRPDDTMLGRLEIDAPLLESDWIEQWRPVEGGLDELADYLDHSIELAPFLPRGLHQPGQTLRTTDEVIGDSQAGYFLQTGGLHTVENDVVLGKAESGFGLYLLDAPFDGVFRVRRDLTVGAAGAGVFQQLGGQLIVQRDLWFGRYTDGSGLGLSAGPIDVWGKLVVGGQGIGGLVIDGSTLSVGGDTIVGASSGSQGDVWQGPLGAALLHGDLTVGDAGQGSWTNAGIGSFLEAQGSIILGKSATGRGKLDSLGGAPVVAGVDFIIGDLGYGVGVNQAGPHVGQDMILGRQAGSEGGYAAGAGLYVVRDLVIGDQGVGELSFGIGPGKVDGSVVLGRGNSGDGHLAIAFGDWDIGGDLRIGGLGQGSLVSSFSEISVTGSLVIGDTAGSNGSLGLESAVSPYTAAVIGSTDAFVGRAGTGELTLILARMEATGVISIGEEASSSGTIRLLGSSLVDSSTVEANEIVVGRRGAGTIESEDGVLHATLLVVGDESASSGELTGSSWIHAGNFVLGRGTGSSGDAELPSGGLYLSSLWVGLGGSGRLALGTDYTGIGSKVATLQVAGDFNIAQETGSAGTVEIIGRGRVEVGGNLVFGAGAGGLEYRGSILETGGLHVGSNSTLEFFGVNDQGPLFPPGYVSLGAVQQRGGSVTFETGTELIIRDHREKEGYEAVSYNLEDGILSVPRLRIAGGSFSQSGGSLQTNDLVYESGTLSGVITSSGTFTLAPLAPEFSATLHILGDFTLDQPFAPTGGLISEGDTTLAEGAELSGGPLVIADGNFTMNAGSSVDVPAATVTGGTVTVEGGADFFADSYTQEGGSTHVLDDAAFGITNAFTINGGLFTAYGGSWLSAGNYTVNGGTFTVQANATTNLAGSTLTVGGTGTVSLNSNATFLLPTATTVSGTDSTTGTLTGTGSWQLNAGHMLHVNRGALTGSGGLTVVPGAELLITASDADLGRDVTNQGSLRMNVADVLHSPLAGNATITNASSGTLRILDAPHSTAGYNPNGIFADGLSIVNAGTFTLGKLSAADANERLTLFSTEGSFSNSGSVTLTHSAELRLLGGGTQTGSFTLGDENSHLMMWGHDIAASTTFGGAGLVELSGGTLRTTPGIFTPGYRLSFVNDEVSLPEATGLNVTGEFNLAANLATLPVRVLDGGAAHWSHGASAATITVDDGGELTLGGGAGAGLQVYTAGVAKIDGDIENHGSVRIWGSYDGSPMDGDGTLRNRLDGELHNGVLDGAPSPLVDFLVDIVNEGLMAFEARDAATVRLGSITNTGTLNLKATEAAGDAADDVRLEVGAITQTAGTTLLEGKLWSSGGWPDPVIQIGTIDLLGGTATASGRLVTSVFNNGTRLDVGSAGLIVAGNFNNQSGGVLYVPSTYTQASGTFVQQAGSRVILDGQSANLIIGGSPVYHENYTVPTGVTLELRNKTPATSQTLTTNGTLIFGTGTVHTQWGGNLDGAGEVRVGHGGTLWLGSGGNYSASTPLIVEAGGLLQLQGHVNNINRFYGRPLTNHGTVDHIASHVGMSSTSTVTNHGLWIDRAGLTFVATDGQPGGGVFHNHGTFRKTGANQAGFDGTVVFNNTGTIDIQQGSVGIYGNGSFSGTSVANMAAGTHLTVQQGTVTIGDGAQFNGPLSLGPAGTRVMTGNIHASDAAFWGGTLDGTHTLHGSWRMSNGASLWNTGSTTIANGAAWEFGSHDNAINRLYGHTFVNHGTVTRTGAHIGLNAATTITNHGIWVESAGNSFTSADGQSSGGVFHNHGTFRKSGDTGQAGFATSVVLNNTGTIDVQNGSVGIYGNAHFAGTTVANMAAGTYLLIREGTVTIADGARFNGDLSLGPGGNRVMTGNIHATNVAFWGGAISGTHRLHGTWTMSHGSSLGISGSTTIAPGGTWNFAGNDNGISRLYGHTFINQGTVNQTATALAFSATTAVTNEGTWIHSGNASNVGSYEGQAAGGSFVNAGTFIKSAGNQLGFEASGPIFTNEGTLDIGTGGSVRFDAGRLGNRVDDKLVGGTWIIRNGAYIRDDAGGYATLAADVTQYGTGGFWHGGTTRNEGTHRLLEGATFTTASAFTNTGTLLVGPASSFNSTAPLANSGLLTIDGAFASTGLSNTGTLNGVGTLAGAVTSSGTIRPGHSPGELTFTGNLTLLGTSVMLMEIGGATEGATYDAVNVGGTLAFGGTLTVSLINAFAPPTASTFNLFDATTFTGTFATLNLPGLTQGLSWDTSALYSSGVLSIQGTAIPEPSTYAAIIGALALAGAVWRRRVRNSHVP